MGKTALITGIIGGVGSATARTLIAEGWTVIGTVRTPEQIAEVRSEVPGIDNVVVLDLSDADSVAPVLTPLLASYRTLDALVMTAGSCPFGPLETTPLSELRRVMEINTVSSAAIYQSCIAQIRRSKGYIVIVSSGSGKVARPFLGHYAASKFALEALADVMRRESRDWGVQVVVVEPGGMKSRMIDLQLRQIRERKAALSDEERARYGHLYDLHEYGVSDKNVGLRPPEEAADAIVKALNTPRPDTRYTVGGATYLSLLARTKSDQEIDELMTSPTVWGDESAA